MKMTKQAAVESAIKQFVNLKKTLKVCGAVEINDNDKKLYLFNSPEAEKDIIDCFIDGVENRIKKLIEEREKLRNESEVK